jgi:hypothetical protein
MELVAKYLAKIANQNIKLILSGTTKKNLKKANSVEAFGVVFYQALNKFLKSKGLHAYGNFHDLITPEMKKEIFEKVKAKYPSVDPNSTAIQQFVFFCLEDYSKELIAKIKAGEVDHSKRIDLRNDKKYTFDEFYRFCITHYKEVMRHANNIKTVAVPLTKRSKSDITENEKSEYIEVYLNDLGKSFTEEQFFKAVIGYENSDKKLTWVDFYKHHITQEIDRELQEWNDRQVRDMDESEQVKIVSNARKLFDTTYEELLNKLFSGKHEEQIKILKKDLNIYKSEFITNNRKAILNEDHREAVLKSIPEYISEIFREHLKNLESLQIGNSIKISKILRDPSEIMDEIEAPKVDSEGNPLATHTKCPSFILNGNILVNVRGEEKTDSFAFKIKLNEDGNSILGIPEMLRKPVNHSAYFQLDILQNSHTIFQKMFLPGIKQSHAYAIWEREAHPDRETKTPAPPEMKSYITNLTHRTLPERPTLKTFNVGQRVRHTSPVPPPNGKSLGLGVVMPPLPPKVMDKDGEIVDQPEFKPPKTVSTEKIRVNFESTGKVSIVRNQDLT